MTRLKRATLLRTTMASAASDANGSVPKEGAIAPASTELTPRATYNTLIREMAPTDRPRERLRDVGPESLSTPELLAIVLRTGNLHQSALGLAQALLTKHGGLSGL